MSTTIPDHELDLALAAFPDWLADEVRTEIRAKEQRGWQFATAIAAVKHHLEAQAG